MKTGLFARDYTMAALAMLYTFVACIVLEDRSAAQIRAIEGTDMSLEEETLRCTDCGTCEEEETLCWVMDDAVAPPCECSKVRRALTYSIRLTRPRPAM